MTLRIVSVVVKAVRVLAVRIVFRRGRLCLLVLLVVGPAVRLGMAGRRR